jgi:hypothetical protein
MTTDTRMIAAKISDENKRIKYYSNQLLDLVKKEFATRKINMYDYERFINILTCLNLTVDDTRKEIDEFIRYETAKRVKINVLV